MQEYPTGREAREWFEKMGAVDEEFHPQEDELFTKYRVFYEPEFAPEHPVELDPPEFYINGRVTGELAEVTSFIFVLKPDTDPHARVALATYAESVRPLRPQLAADLDLVLTEWR